MRKLTSFMHVSLNGLVAGPNGEMNWIHVDEDIFDVAARISDGADMALYGRVTFEMMENYWPTAGDSPDASKHDKHHSAWYNKVPKLVLSKSWKGRQLNNATIISDDISSHINQVKQQQGKDIVIFGSPGATHSLMQLNLIDDYWLFINPVVLPEGIPMFSGVKEPAHFTLAETKNISGVVCVHYILNKP